MVSEEKIYTVPLGKAYDYIRTKRARRAIAIVQIFITKHSKVPAKNVRISNALNTILWANGIQKPPRKIKIKVVKDADFAYAYAINEKITPITSTTQPQTKGTVQPSPSVPTTQTQIVPASATSQMNTIQKANEEAQEIKEETKKK